MKCTVLSLLCQREKKDTKYYNFWPNFRRKIQSVLSINLTLFDQETQNLKVRSITETVLEKSKQKTF